MKERIDYYLERNNKRVRKNFGGKNRIYKIFKNLIEGLKNKYFRK